MKKINSWLLASVFLLSTFSVSSAQSLADGDASNDSCLDIKSSMLRFRSNDANTNGEVSDLQDFLIEKNLLSGQASGYFGRLTVNAVKSYQKSIGLSPTGNVGPLTKSYIKNETCNINIVTKPANNNQVSTNTNTNTNTNQGTLFNLQPKIESVSFDKASGKFTVYGKNLLEARQACVELVVDGAQCYIVENKTENSLVFYSSIQSDSRVNITLKNENLKSNPFELFINNKTKLISSLATQQNEANMNTQITYDIENYRNNYVLDVSVKVDCNYVFTNTNRDCAQYLFDITGSGASESYIGVKAEPYVSGGSSNRFVGKNGKLIINSYPNPNFYFYPGMVKVPDNIIYNIKIVDTNTGAEIDSVKYSAAYKG